MCSLTDWAIGSTQAPNMGHGCPLPCLAFQNSDAAIVGATTTHRSQLVPSTETSPSCGAAGERLQRESGHVLFGAPLSDDRIPSAVTHGTLRALCCGVVRGAARNRALLTARRQQSAATGWNPSALPLVSSRATRGHDFLVQPPSLPGNPRSRRRLCASFPPSAGHRSTAGMRHDEPSP